MAKSCISSSVLVLFISLAIFVPFRSNATTPAMFIFGDSLADVGTNNFVPGSQIRANFPHNGIDFPRSRPTGRFSNGFNGADYLAKLMGFRRSPLPFLYLINLKTGLHKRIFRGANFASGGSGILDITGQTVVAVPLSEQIKQFATVRNNITARMGPSAAEKFLSESIFTISVGANDIFGYFLTNSTVHPAKFLETLMTTYESQIKALYNLGSRKFGIVSVPAIGCCPSQRLYNATGGCLEAMNTFAKAFYTALRHRVLYNIASQLDGMKYSLGNTFEMSLYAINNPHLFGFKNVETGCCGLGKLNAEQGCLPTANLCSNRREYFFWDLVHPSQKASKLAAQTLYGGGPKYVTPINFAQLAADN